jgi:hypothetical protein
VVAAGAAPNVGTSEVAPNPAPVVPDAPKPLPVPEEKGVDDALDARPKAGAAAVDDATLPNDGAVEGKEAAVVDALGVDKLNAEMMDFLAPASSFSLETASADASVTVDAALAAAAGFAAAPKFKLPKPNPPKLEANAPAPAPPVDAVAEVAIPNPPELAPNAPAPAPAPKPTPVDVPPMAGAKLKEAAAAAPVDVAAPAKPGVDAPPKPDVDAPPPPKLPKEGAGEAAEVEEAAVVADVAAPDPPPPKAAFIAGDISACLMPCVSHGRAAAAAGLEEIAGAEDDVDGLAAVAGGAAGAGDDVAPRPPFAAFCCADIQDPPEPPPEPPPAPPPKPPPVLPRWQKFSKESALVRVY